MKQLLKTLILTTIFFICSCSAHQAINVEESNPITIQCQDPRPQLCTQEYAPVCAEKLTGIYCITTPCPSTEQLTYATGCTACADKKVMAYHLGACK